MTLTALIVDDEPPARRRLRVLLEDEPGVHVIGDCEDGAQALAFIRARSPDIVFLDVQMPGMDGFDVIEELGGQAPLVIFVTAYDRHALRAFEVHAVDYLLKPFDRERLRHSLDRARALRLGETDLAKRLLALVTEMRAGKPLRRFVVKSSGRVSFVDVAEVDWIEASGHYICLHTGKRSHLLRGALAAIEPKLDGETFVRIHRSTIVNVERIKQVEPTFHGDHVVTLEDGTRLECSRSFAPRLRRVLDA